MPRALSTLPALNTLSAHTNLSPCLPPISGVVIDYVLHLTYSTDTWQAVLFSCTTSVCGFVPYVFTTTRGIREFATVFIVGIVAGAAYAFLAVSIQTQVSYTAVHADAEKEFTHG